MKPRPRLSQLAASMDVVVTHGVMRACHQQKIMRKSEADTIGEHLTHVRDLMFIMAANPQATAWLIEGVPLAPVSHITAQANRIADDGGVE